MKPVDEEPKPTIPHAYLTTGSGAPLKFWRMLPEACPACGRGPNPARLAIMSEGQGVETVHCVKCDYSMTRRPKKNPQFRPMNSGGQG
jgi:uncharacterized metal-binding protein (TIGR02443 family)